MTEEDCPEVFARTLWELMVETFAEHGIEQLYVDEAESIMNECIRRCYEQSVMELRITQGIPPLG